MNALAAIGRERCWRGALSCTLIVLLLPACASRYGAEAQADVFNALPLLPGSAMVLDGSWRLHIELRGHAAGAEQHDLLLVLRSDAGGFRFEAMNELGLPVLTWPATSDTSSGHGDVGLNGGMDVSLVARFIQLALADSAVWAAALQGRRMQLVAAADGSRTLFADARPRVHISAPGAVRHMLVCAQGAVVGDGCQSGAALRIDVEALPQAVDP